jgi:hypothetical protein
VSRLGARRILWTATVLLCAAGCSGGSSKSSDGATTSPSSAPLSVPLGPIRGGKVTVPPLPTGPTSSVPSVIAADCSVDVTNALQSWIDSTPDNSTLSLGSHACYRIDETLTLRNRHRVLLDGNGATLKAVTMGTRKRIHLLLSGGSDITVRDLVVRGANPHAGATRAAYIKTLEAQHGFEIDGVSGVLLDDVHVSDVYGDFVYIGLASKQPSRNVTVAHSRFERSGRQGITVTSGIGVDIVDNVITDVARSLFDLEANGRSTQIENIRIMGNVTGRAVNFWLADKGADARIGNVQIVGNRMAEATGGLVFVFGTGSTYRGPFVIEANHLIANDRVNDEGSSGAFFFTHAQDVTIRQNTVVFPSGHRMPAIELRDSHDVVANDNQFEGAGTLVIASDGSADYHVS